MLIREKTVFILGAGASFPYGYPLGEKLKSMICHDIDYGGIARCLYKDKKEIEDCAKGIIKFQQYFSKSPLESVDQFLKINQEYANIGKQIIASILYPLENNDYFVNSRGNNWYRFLWNIIDNKFENIAANNIHFVTFNYDRSFEQFLFQSLYNSYSGKKSEEDCAKIINKIDIIHVYGSLAPLVWQDKINGRAYTAGVPNEDVLLKAIKNIFLIGEERAFTEQQRKIQEIMPEAKYIYFLGFGYDEENMKILGGNFEKALKIWGTSLNLGGFKKRNATEIIYRKKIWRPEVVRFHDLDCYDFLKEEVVLK